MAAKTVFHAINRLKRTLFLVLLLILPVSYSQAMVVYEDVSFIRGVDGVEGSFNVTQAGQYEAMLVDFVFPTEFDSLGLQITDASTFEHRAEYFSTNGGFTLTFDAQPGLHYVNVLGDAGGDLDIGLYGLKISAVPLPSAIVLLISAIGLLGTFAWRKRVSENSPLLPPANGVSWSPA
ncbi:MAG: PEP-CTERM sorting domain-containing protein [Gammaproteobacteria bacterium]|jgi:hypothetical protein